MSMTGRFFVGAMAVVLPAGIAWADAGRLAFKQASEGEYAFDTGRLTGRLVCQKDAASIVSLADSESGVEITGGHEKYGLLSYYRLLSPDHRYGGVLWDMPKQATLLPGGAVRIDWPAASGCPLALSAVYRWVAPDTLDVETIVSPQRDLPKFEVFIGSYFNADTRCYVYLNPPRSPQGPASFLSADGSPMLAGTYLAFPRDLEHARLVFDGRWEQGQHPVQWSVSRYLGGALALRQDDKHGLTAALMSKPEDCAVIYCSYNAPPDDGVARHYSTYLGLFGRDLKKGEAAKTTSRLVVLKGTNQEEAVKRYRAFVSVTE